MTFKGYKDIYPEKVDGTDSWYFGQWTPCSVILERSPGYLRRMPDGSMWKMTSK